MATYQNSTLPLIILAFALLAILASATIPVIVKQAKDQKGAVMPLPSITPFLTPNPLPSISETGVKKEVKKTGTSNYKKSEKGEFMWMYPGSKIVHQDGETTILEVADDADSVTNWYKEKIAFLGFRATTFSQTNVNNSVHNVLTGVSGQDDIRVEITRSSESLITQIRVVTKKI